jgi:hypothetical protein
MEEAACNTILSLDLMVMPSWIGRPGQGSERLKDVGRFKGFSLRRRKFSETLNLNIFAGVQFS